MRYTQEKKYRLSKKTITVLFLIIFTFHTIIILKMFKNSKRTGDKKENTKIIVTQAKLIKKVAPKPIVKKKVKTQKKKIKKAVIKPKKIEEKKSDTVVVKKDIVVDTNVTKKVIKKVVEMGPSKEKIDNIKNKYLLDLKQKLEDMKKYPRMAKRMEQEGIVIVNFSISKEGNLNDIEISKKCKYSLLNKEAKKTVAKLGKYKKIPGELKITSWKIEVPIKFSIN